MTFCPRRRSLSIARCSIIDGALEVFSDHLLQAREEIGHAVAESQLPLFAIGHFLDVAGLLGALPCFVEQAAEGVLGHAAFMPETGSLADV